MPVSMVFSMVVSATPQRRVLPRVPHVLEAVPVVVAPVGARKISSRQRARRRLRRDGRSQRFILGWVNCTEGCFLKEDLK